MIVKSLEHLNSLSKKVADQLTKMSKDQADYISVKPSGPFKPDTYRY